MRIRGYKIIAPFYEHLRNFFFPAIKKYQGEFHKLKPQLIDRIVIVGGGSGDILRPVLKKFSKSTVYFVEPSNSMMERAQERFGTSRRVFFIQEPIENAVVEDADLVLLPFVVDILEEQQLIPVAKKTRELLKNKGFVLFSDFLKPRTFSARLKLSVLYMLFMPIRGKFQTSLPDYDDFFKTAGLRKVTEKQSQSGLFVSELYQKV